MTDFARTRSMFHLPSGVVYLDGNSLGPMPAAAPVRVAHTIVDEWGRQLIAAWNSAGWMRQPCNVGDRIGKLIGAPPGSIAVGDTLSIKVYQAVAAALELNPDRRIILSDSGNFPSDLYMVEGLIRTLGRGYELRIVRPEDVAEAVDSSVAVLMLTEVDYRTGRLHDMTSMTQRAHSVGALTVWDLAHSAGAIPVDVLGADADFAVGCTYKYLNGGPGAPAFIYVAERHAGLLRPALAGWLGHEAPFAFDVEYRPGVGIDRLRVGSPPVIAMAALEAALDIWDVADIHDVRSKSIELSELFIREVCRDCPTVELASPRDPLARGSQVSFRHPDAYPIMQALIDKGVIGDFRAPDILRFGITPLYVGETEIIAAARTLRQILGDRSWDHARYRQRALVT
jgi:kynureninase